MRHEEVETERVAAGVGVGVGGLLKAGAHLLRLPCQVKEEEARA